MKIKILYFALIREAIGFGSEELSVDGISSVSDLRNVLFSRGGAYAEVLAYGKAVRCAVNQVMTDESALLTDGAQVAFFPPVTGG